MILTTQLPGQRPRASQPFRTPFAPIRLHLMPDAPNAEGEPRAALLVPASEAALTRRPVLLMFASIGAAIAAKREMEGRR